MSVMSPKWAELQKLSDEELIATHDRIVEHVSVASGYFVEELRYRQQSRINRSMKRMTHCILWLTVTVTMATIINVAIALC